MRSPTPQITPFLNTAHRLADVSAAAILPHFRRSLEIDNKGGKIEDVVAQWLKDNEATWKPWIDGASM